MNKIINDIVDVVKSNKVHSSDKEVRISESYREGETDLYVDIRWFKLIPISGHYDGVLKASPKGIHFSFAMLPKIIAALIKAYENRYGRKFDINNYK